MQRRAVGTATRRTFVQAAHGKDFDPKLQRNKYHSVLDGEFKLVSGEVLPEVRIDWEQWVCAVCDIVSLCVGPLTLIASVLYMHAI